MSKAGLRRREAGMTYSNLNAIVGEDKRRVGRSELGSRHCDVFGVLVNSWNGGDGRGWMLSQVASRLEFPL